MPYLQARLSITLILVRLYLTRVALPDSCDST